MYLVDLGHPPKCVSSNFGELNRANFAPLEELRKHFASGLDRNFGVHFSRPEDVNAVFPVEDLVRIINGISQPFRLTVYVKVRTFGD